MKVKSKRFLSSLMVMLLVCMMAIASGCSGLIDLPQLNSDSDSESSSDSYILNQGSSSDTTEYLNKDQLLEKEGIKALSDNDEISLMIEVSEESLYTLYKKSKSGLTYQEYIISREGRVNAEKMVAKHNEIFDKISKKLDTVSSGSITGLLNMFAIRIKYGDRDKAGELALKFGAVSTAIGEVYAKPETLASDDGIVYNSIDVYDTGIFDTSGLDYQGEGMVVAVLDTGLDYEHKAFSTDNLPKVGNTNVTDQSRLGLTQDQVKSKISRLAAAAATSNLTISDVYVNDKVPYAYDYSDLDTEVNTTEANAHGTHVAGIIAGKCTEVGDDFVGPHNPETCSHVKNDQDGGRCITGFVGAAPLAQIAVMKVFSDYSSGAEEFALLFAVNDCAALGVDAINMSLGTTAGFSDQSETEGDIQKAYNIVSEMGINLVVAAGNAYSAGYSGHFGTNLTSNPDSGIVGSPASYYAAYTVASIDGVKTKYLKATDNSGSQLGIAYFTESAKTDGTKNDFIDFLIKAVNGQNICGGVNANNEPIGIDYTNPAQSGVESYYDATTQNYKIPYVVIPGVGDPGNYSQSVQGKIAVVQRGVTTFTKKLTTAKNAKNALGVIVTNNVAGVISMSTEEEVNEHFNFPACSITMDAARSIRGVTEGYIIVNKDFGGGPFMSEFSSFGPLPSLELKPEITGHGGEIYSAYPGGNYSRISGTSMACPNIAGITLIMRQHILESTTATEDPYNIKYTSGEFEGQINYGLLEDRIYQIMMSTATQPINQYGGYYSPRKVGAGVANTIAMINTQSYLTVKGNDGTARDRTKLELFDYPDRGGVFEMSATVNNISEDKDMQFELSAEVFTETVSSDGETVAERAYSLTATKAWTISALSAAQGSISGSTITVKAGQTLDVNLRITLSAESKQYLETNFKNGMFVEGFMRFTSVDLRNLAEGEDNIYANLSVPYLAFYGDWTDAPIYDYSVYETDPDFRSTSMEEDQKRFSQNSPLTAYGKVTQGQNDYYINMGAFIFRYPEELESSVPYAEEAKTSLSFKETSMYELYYVAGFLRGVKYATFKVIDVTTGRVLTESQAYNARKAAAAGNAGGMKVEISPKKIGCKGGGTYRFEMQCYLDYDKNKEDNIPYSMSKPKEDGTSTSAWGFNFTIDTDAPVLYDAEIRFERNNTKGFDKFLDVYVRDEHYLQAAGFETYNKSLDNFENFYEDGMRPVTGSRNAITKLTYNLTSYWEWIKDNEKSDGTWPAMFEFYDFGFNNSYYEVDLKKLAITASTIEFVDIGTYNPYYNQSDFSDSIKVLESCSDKYNLNETIFEDGKEKPLYYEEDGVTLKTMDSIVIRPNQKVELTNALYMQPAGSWFDDLVWTVEDPAVVNMQEKSSAIAGAPRVKTGSIVGANPGTTKVTVSSRTNPEIKKELTVKVLSDAERETYRIAATSEINTVLTGLTGNLSYVALKPGETRTVSFNLDPWFNNSRIQSVTWSGATSATSPITLVPKTQVVVDGRLSEVVAEVTGKQGTYDVDNDACIGNYSPNRSTAITLSVAVRYKSLQDETVRTVSGAMVVGVLPEFEIDNGTLKKYNGTRTNVVIPYNNIEGQKIKVIAIGDSAFRSLNHVTRVVIPEGVTSIGGSAFAYMKNLREVILPSTLKSIGNWAFAAYDDPVSGITTSLQVVNNTTDENGVPRTMTEPATIGYAAFINQRALGTSFTFVNGDIATLGATPLISSKLDLSSFRIVGGGAFYGCQYMHEIDVTKIRAMDTLAFATAGIYTAYYATKNTAGFHAPVFTFDKLTAVGTAAFLLAGIVDLRLPMKRIPDSAFQNCIFLNNVVFEADSVSIGTNAFFGSWDPDIGKGLKGITFNENVESIGTSAFADNDYLKTVNFAKNVRVIGDKAFEATSLTAFTLPGGLVYLGDAVFGACPKLETLNISSNFNTPNINLKSAFAGTNIKYIFYNGVSSGGNSYVSVQNNMLLNYDATDLIFYVTAPSNTSFTLPSTVTRIRPYAFAGSKIRSFTATATLETIGNGAFMNSALRDFTATGLTEIPEYAFYGSANLRTVNLGTISKIKNYAFAGTVIELFPASTIAAASEIGVGAFMNSTALTSFTIPAGITAIPADLFNGCTKLSFVTFHSNIKAVGNRAFAYTKIAALEGDTVANIERVGDFAFAGCSMLATVKLPSLKNVGSSAFGIGVSETVTREVAFEIDGMESDVRENVVYGDTIVYGGTSALSTLEVNNAETISDYAFFGQTALTSASLPKAKIIGDSAFANSGLKSVTFPVVQKIGNSAFLNCALGKDSESAELAIPETVTHIGSAAFAGNYLTAFNVDQDNTEYLAIDGVLFRHIETYAPKGENTPGYELIQYADGDANKTDYVIPEGTIRINDFAFHLVQTLESVTMPETLTNIGHGAFYKVKNLKDYTFRSYNAPVLESWFGFKDTSDTYDPYWAYFNNFFDNFTVESFDDNGNPVGNWIFNSVTKALVSDSFAGINNASALEGGFSGKNYGLRMNYPSNGVGYDGFIYDNYFTTKTAGGETAEPETQAIIDGINALPATTQFTHVEVALVESYREAYERLSDAQKALITNIGALVLAEAYIASGRIKSYTVTYMVSKTVYLVQSVPEGGKAKAPTKPAFAYGNFLYWTLNDAEYNFAGAVNGNITLSAKFNHNDTKFMVSFADCNLAAFESLAGYAVDLPATAPTKKGYTFVRWELNGAEYDINAPLTEDITLKAIWKKDKGNCGCGTVDLFNLVGLAMLLGLIGSGAFIMLKKRQKHTAK